MTRHACPSIAVALALTLFACDKAPSTRAVPGSAETSAEASTPPPTEVPPAPVVPQGTVLTAALQSALSSETSGVGAPVVATLTEPLAVDGVTVVPAGAELRGRVTAVQAAGKLKGRSRLAFELSEITLDGKKRPISLSAVDISGEAQTKKNAVAIGGGAGAGAVVGAIAGGKKGAAIGAAVGGGAGTAGAAVKGGDQVELPAGHAVKVKLTGPFSR